MNLEDGERASPIRTAGAAGPEVERVMTACIFAIATGRWAPDDPVPSVRRGAELWSASPATVHRAYQLLAERGVLVGKIRRGYFVRPGRPVEHLVRHLDTLAKLYTDVRSQVEAVPELSPVGTFRHMLGQAERDAAARPECGFVECTLSQSRRHASEIEARLAIPCHVFDTVTIRPEGWRAPPGLRVLLTTAFHADEVAPIGARRGIRTVTVPLTCSTEDVQRLSRGATRLRIRSVDPEQGRLVADDVRRILGGTTPPIDLRGSSPAAIEAELVAMLGSPDAPRPGVAVVLSMSLWESLPESWRSSGVVHPYPYSIDARAWAGVATNLGLPLAV